MIECDECGDEMEERFPNQFTCPNCGLKKLRAYDYDDEGNILAEEIMDDDGIDFDIDEEIEAKADLMRKDELTKVEE
jgi:transcription initiation factor IIE alpha subunit